ncbi:mycofactocin-coupled SDR family oxidoreductase [Pseudonocardia sp. GCM10023141]|uniref:mycofactocin-coupled SDR family oxidoreductase n=1 Tax=Pseudonocardia sp. GCM10023141 TaxID=3252653 RepID=UPI003605ADC6
MDAQPAGGQVQGKVAFVTGAARGQGRSHAVRLAAEGADIIAVDVCAPDPTAPYPMADAADLAETVRQVEATGRRIVARQADVRDPAALRAAVADGVAAFGRLDIVLANAGIAHYSRAVDLDDDDWTQLIDVDLNGVWWTVKAALPHLIAGGRGGSIVLTSSTAGLRGLQNCVHYVTAKHGLVGMAKALALELGRHDIRVNTIHPNSVNTAMLQNAPTWELFLPGRANPTPEQFERVARSLNVLPTPWSEPADISDIVLFLVSEAARTITGIAFPVDAGQSVRW